MTLSGSKEGALVVWELDTEKKQVLPMMESPLLYFISSSDPTLSSVSHIQSLCAYIFKCFNNSTKIKKFFRRFVQIVRFIFSKCLPWRY